MDRYHRQTLLNQIGHEGQNRLRASRVLLIGCGALGSTIAEQLVRAGIGSLRLADRDIVEYSNLHRQCLYDEADARDGAPKALAAAERLSAINRDVTIDPHAADVASDNILALADGVDLILDGSDNVATRYLINDAAVKLRLPWVYGACVGVEGRMMAVRPGESACLRCVFPDPPPPQELPTCDTAGVLGSIANIIASFQTIAAMQILLGQPDLAAGRLRAIDGWTGNMRSINVLRAQNCRCCVVEDFECLNASPQTGAALCGRDAVQVRPANGRSIDLTALADRLNAVAIVRRSAAFLRCDLNDGGRVITVFPDGRAIVQGTSDVARARSLYARYVGE